MIITKTCPKCNVVFEQEITKGYGRSYCSRKCSNTRSHSKETKEKIRRSSIDTWNTKTKEGKEKALAALLKGKETRAKNRLKFLRETDTVDLTHEARKQKVFLEQDKSCLKCEITDWNSMPITFELDHIDGNKHNNLRENLRVLCPNCHSQTPTWRGRKNGIK